MNAPRSSARAFSLLEVVVALGLVAFVLVAIIGLFGVGLSNVQDSEKHVEAANVAKNLFELRAAAPSATIPDFPLPELNLNELPTNPPENWEEILVGADGSTALDPGEESFRLSYRIWLDPASSTSQKLARIHLILSWPANAPTPNAGTQYDLISSVPLP